MKEYKTNITKAIRGQLESSSELCVEALGIIRAYQTSDEYFTGDVRWLNYQGFTPHDSKTLTSYAISEHKYGSYTPAQVEVIHQLMPKYARQIRDHFIAKGKIVKSNDSRFEWEPSDLWSEYGVVLPQPSSPVYCGPTHDESWYETMQDDANYFSPERFYSEMME